VNLAEFRNLTLTAASKMEREGFLNAAESLRVVYRNTYKEEMTSTSSAEETNPSQSITLGARTH